jgi:hypothetical protein
MGIPLKSQRSSRNGIGQRRIADVWLALRITATIFGQVNSIGVFAPFFIPKLSLNHRDAEESGMRAADLRRGRIKSCEEGGLRPKAVIQ